MNRQLRPLVLIILSVLLLSKLSLAPVKAEIICQNTTPIAAYNDSQVKLQGNTLLWLNETHALKRYDLVSEITSEIATEAGNFDVDGDHIVFTDPADQIQLYTISTGSTTPITGGSKQYSDPRIEGNNVVYRKRKLATDGKVYYRLYVYDIVLATKTAVGHKYPKSYDYDLDQGRILWGGNNLYTIATGSNTSLGSYNFVDLDGDHAVTVIRADYASNVILKELSSGKVSQLTHYSSGEVGEVIDINSVELGGDYVTWAVDITDSEGSYGGVLLYQISTGKQIDPGMPENRFPFAGIHEPFVSGKLLDDTLTTGICICMISPRIR